MGEFQNAIEHALILIDGVLISGAQLGLAPPSNNAGTLASPAGAERRPPAPLQALSELEEQAVIEALQRTHGNKSHAAVGLGLSRTRFYTLRRALAWTASIERRSRLQKTLSTT